MVGTETKNHGEEAALLSRLQSQFGDMDITNFLLNQNNEEKKQADGDVSSEESSLKEPSPEELRLWQERQFKKGQKELTVRKEKVMTPLQKRRMESKKKRDAKQAHHDLHLDDDDDVDIDDWEEVAALPDLNGESSSFFPKCDSKGNEFLGIHPMLQELALKGDPDILGTQWKRLYSSDAGDGLSFPKLLSTLKGYSGPTVMLIGCIPSLSRLASTSSGKNTSKGSTIGVFTTSPWTESIDFFGSGNECFMFAFDDEHHEHDGVKFFRPKQQRQQQQEPAATSGEVLEDQLLHHELNACSKNYMYCHPSSLTISNRRTSSKGTSTDGHVHGIGIGGTTAQPRLHITESLEDCRAMDYDKLFEEGDLLLGTCNESLYYFDVDCLEIWAIGGNDWIEQSLNDQRKERDIAIANLQRNLRVDKKQFVDDFRGGKLLGKTNPLFEHNNHTMGRTDL